MESGLEAFVTTPRGSISRQTQFLSPENLELPEGPYFPC